jgi:hypothetical protein
MAGYLAPSPSADCVFNVAFDNHRGVVHEIQGFTDVGDEEPG